MRTIRREAHSTPGNRWSIAPQRPHADSHRPTIMSRAYLLGALHDGTERKYTYRLSQNDSEYVETIASLVESIGFDAWTYREGQTRDMYVAEFIGGSMSRRTPTRTSPSRSGRGIHGNGASSGRRDGPCPDASQGLT